MNYYAFTDKLRTILKEEPFVNTVTSGDISAVDIKKQTIYPLVHIIPNNVSFNGNTITYNVSLIGADLVDVSKEATTDQMTGNDNEVDVINTIQALFNRVFDRIKRGDLYADMEVDNASIEYFRERFENNLAGCTFTFDVTVANEMSIC